MHLITKNDSFLDLKKSLFIANFYAFLIVFSYLFLTFFANNYSNMLAVYRPYFLLGNSMGGYILSYFWAFMDAFTICMAILGITTLLNHNPAEDEPTQSNPDIL
jgi:uncharacterized RDD family membrane protein YckC